MFAVFNDIKPTLAEVTGLRVQLVPLVLALFGLGMVVGNLVGSRLAGISLQHTIAGLLLWDVLVMAAFPFTAPYPLLAALNVFLVGTLVAIAPALQIRLMDVAGKAQTLAAALNHSAFNLANALGAWLGGLAITPPAWAGRPPAGWVGVLLALAGMVVSGAALWLDRRSRARLAA